MRTMHTYMKIHVCSTLAERAKTGRKEPNPTMYMYVIDAEGVYPACTCACTEVLCYNASTGNEYTAAICGTYPHREEHMYM